MKAHQLERLKNVFTLHTLFPNSHDVHGTYNLHLQLFWLANNVVKCGWQRSFNGYKVTSFEGSSELNDFVVIDSTKNGSWCVYEIKCKSARHEQLCQAGSKNFFILNSFFLPLLRSMAQAFAICCVFFSFLNFWERIAAFSRWLWVDI